MAKYTELTVSCLHDGAELVADLLSEYSAEGVAVSDIEDVKDLERRGKTWDYADEEVYAGDSTVLVKAFIIKDGNELSVLKEISERLIALKESCPFDLGTLETKKRTVDGDEWKDIWKEHFKPIHFGKIVVVPEWIKYQPKPEELEVLIGSNMAFGTGEHETTGMCVEYLEKYVNKDDTVIDVGCGSGILGIAASKLGAKEVLLTDIDECAVTASNQNIALNGVKNSTVLLKNLLDDESIKGDIIVCNIMAEVLIAFAPYIGKNLLDNGKVILSGILADRLERVKAAYIENGFSFIESKIKGEWSACVFERAE